MRYPVKKINGTPSIDKKSGGSVTYVTTEPDFDSFTKEHWMIYQAEQQEKEKNRLVMWLGMAVFAIIFLVSYISSDGL